MARTTVALLFSDIEGSTRLLQQLGPAYVETLFEHRRLLRSAFQAHAGAEQGMEGDSFFVLFSAASDAVAAALDAQRAMASHSWQSEPVKVRMGLHVGEVDRVADAVVGLAVHEAARIASAAHGGQILASVEVSTLAVPLPVGAGWRDLGAHQLKDISQPVGLFQLTHEDLPVQFPPVRTQGSSSNNLPAQPTAFIGREREQEEVKRILESSRLVTLTGVGGAGKSRMALRAAAEQTPRFRDGVWFVDLAPVFDPMAVPARIASSVGVAETATDDICEALRSRRMLLLIDNCEHLIEATADVVDAVLTQCPGVSVLATSREPLGIAGEAVWRIPSLALDDAAALFTSRAQAANSGFTLSDTNRAAVMQVCQRLDAIPLALELAAARLTSLTVEQLALRLDQRFRLLAGGARGGLARHRTLQAAIDWSHELLNEEEKLVLRRVGVFSGFSLEGAEAVCEPDLDSLAVFDVVDRLVRKSLVVAEPFGDIMRYRLLETIRQYALDRLSQAGEVSSTRDAHSRCVQALAAEAELVMWFGGDEKAWLARLDPDEGNVRAALEWALECGDTHRAGDIVFGTVIWSISRGKSKEAYGWAERLLAAEPAGADLALAAFLAMAFASNMNAVTPDLVKRTQATLHWFADSTRPWLQHVVGAYAAAWSYPSGDKAGAERAIAICAEAADALRGLGTHRWVLQPLLWTNLDAGRISEARAIADEGLSAAQDAGLSTLQSRMAINRARIALTEGDLDTAWRYAEQAVAAARTTGETFVVTVGTQILAQVSDERGDYRTAMDLLASIIDAVGESQTPEAAAEVVAKVDHYATLIDPQNQE